MTDSGRSSGNQINQREPYGSPGIDSPLAGGNGHPLPEPRVSLVSHIIRLLSSEKGFGSHSISLSSTWLKSALGKSGMSLELLETARRHRCRLVTHRPGGDAIALDLDRKPVSPAVLILRTRSKPAPPGKARSACSCRKPR